MRVKVIRQQDLKDCGCCCLLSIIKYYNGYIPLEKIRLDTFTDLKGTSAYYLIESAKKYGFDSMGKRTNINNLKNEITPLIAHVLLPNGLNHYIVVYQIKNNKVLVMDPAKGKITMDIEEFKKIWTNIIIIFHPKNKILNYQKTTSIINVFFNYLLQNKKQFKLYILESIILTILLLIIGFFFGLCVNYYTNYSLLIKIFIIFGLLYFLKNLIDFLKNNMQNNIDLNFNDSIICDFNQKIFNLPLSFIQTRSSGEIISRVNELNDVKHIFSDVIVTTFWDSIIFICSFCILMIINYKITIFVGLVAILYLLITHIEGKMVYKNVKNIIESESGYNNLLIENINMYESIVNLNIGNVIIKKINEKLKNLNEKKYIFQKKENIIMLLKNSLYDLTYFISIIALFLVLRRNFLNLNQIILYEGFLTFFFLYFNNVMATFPRIYYFKASFEKLSDFYSIDTKKKFPQEFINGNILFDNVSITFNSNLYIQKNINMFIKKNSMILLKGKSGIGKSTLLKTFANNQNYEGKILINNINIKDYSFETIKQNILYVGQNERLFNGTIYENISLNKNISINKLYTICDICKIKELLNSKPLRFMTTIDNETSNISGGERQKIILARSLLMDFKVLILDEALSEVDYDTELNIIKNIKNFYKNKTIIYVSHKNVDRLFENIICLK